MKRYNITTPREYVQNGETKTAWNQVGKLIQFPATADKPEGFILELHMFPNTKFAVFPDRPRENHSQETGVTESSFEYPSEESISPEDIPF